MWERGESDEICLVVLGDGQEGVAYLLDLYRSRKGSFLGVVAL